MTKITTVKQFIKKHQQWEPLLSQLRSILLDCKLEESIKWGMPAYVHAGKNIIGLGAFKKHLTLWFHQGVLLEDKAKILINAQEGKTKAMRQWRVLHKSDIKVRLMKQYIKEAMQQAAEGKHLKVSRKTSNKMPKMPLLLKEALEKNKKLKANFESLSLANRRAYVNYILEAKRDETKKSRISKIKPMILKRMALWEKYKK